MVGEILSILLSEQGGASLGMPLGTSRSVLLNASYYKNMNIYGLRVGIRIVSEILLIGWA